MTAREATHTVALTRLFVPVGAGAAVAVALGVYGGLHAPTGFAVSVAGFSSPLTVKVWLATGAFVFALVQFFSALVCTARCRRWPRRPGSLTARSGRGDRGRRQHHPRMT